MRREEEGEERRGEESCGRRGQCGCVSVSGNGLKEASAIEDRADWLKGTGLSVSELPFAEIHLDISPKLQ